MAGATGRDVHTKDRVLIVLANTARMPGSGRATGVRASEYTEPYEVFSAAGLEVHAASPLGGMAPIDPRSGSADQVERLPTAWAAMKATRPLASVKAEDYVGVFLAGVHGAMWDFQDNADLRRLVEALMSRKAPVGTVCHGPAGLLSARRPDGSPWIVGRRVNGFTNAEEAAAADLIHAAQPG